MKRSTAAVWTAVAVGVPLLAVLVFLGLHVELEPREREVGLRGEAARNRLLALERMLGELGVACEARANLVEIPAQPGVMFWRASGRFAAPVMLERLDQWVQRGSHLIVLLPGEGRAYEQIHDDVEAGRFRVPIASSLGLECGVVADDEDDEFYSNVDAEDEGAEEVESSEVDALEELVKGVLGKTSAEAREVRFEFDLGFGPRNVRMDGAFVLADTTRLADFALPDVDGAQVASFAHGEGRLSVVTSDVWARNLELGELDHARFAWDLARLDGEPERVWIVRGEQPAGLLSTLVRYAWAVLVSVGVAIALGIWRSAARFGPPIPDSLEPAGDGRLAGRRDFSEHIAASAEYLARIGARRELLAAPRRRVAKRLQRLRPEWTELEASERLARLAESSGLEPERIRAALNDDPRGAAAFVRAVRDLEHLRKHL
jgi:hypothetical protein